MDGSITILIDGNNEGLKRKLSESEKLIAESAALAEYSGKKINEMFKIPESSTADLVKVQTIVQNLAERAAAGGKMAGDAYAGMAKEVEGAFADIDGIVGSNNASIGSLADMLGQVKDAAANASNNNDSDTVARLAVYEEKLRTQIELHRENAKEAANLAVELFRVSEASNNGSVQQPVKAQQGPGISAGDAGDASWINGTVQGLEMVSGAFGAARGAASLFGIESKGLQQVMAKLDDVMAIANGLQTISNGLMKSSAFQISVVGGLKKWWAGIMAQATAAQTAGNAATGAGITMATAGTAANTGFALSFRAIGLALKSIPVLGWISIAISGLTALYSLWKSKSDEVEKRQEEAKQRQAEIQKEFNDSVVNNAAPQIAKLELLSAKWKALGNDIKAQDKFIKDNQSAFRDLGLSISDTKDAQNLLVNNTPAVVEALMSQAYAAAYAGRMTKLAAEEIEENERHRNANLKINAIKKYKQEEKGSPDSYAPDVENRTELDKVETANARAEEQKKEDERYRININNIKGGKKYSQKMYLAHTVKSEELFKSAGLKRNEEPGSSVSNAPQDKTADYKAELKKMDEERNQRIDAEKRLSKEVVDTKKMTFKEILDQNEANLKDEEEALKKETEERKKFNERYNKLVWLTEGSKKKGRYVPDDSLTDDDKKEFDARKARMKKNKELADAEAAQANAAATQAARNAKNELIIENGNSKEKRQAVREIYDDKIKKAGFPEKVTFLKNERDNKIKEINYKEFAGPLNLTDVLANIDSFSLEYVKALRDKIKEQLEKQGDTLRPEDIKLLKDAEIKLDAQASKKSGIDFSGISDSVGKVKTTKDELATAEKELNALQEKGCATNEELAKAHNKVQDASEEHANAMKNLNAKYQSGLAQIKQYMEAANAVVGALESMGVEVPDELKGAMEGVSETIDSLSSIDLTNPASIIKGIAGAVKGLFKAISSLFNHDGKKQKQIETIQKQIDALDKAYNKLEKSISKAYSSDARRMIQDQEQMLANQKLLIQEQIALEESKKNKDDAKVQEWKDQLDEIDDQLGDLQDREVEAICGKDIKSAIDEFAQAYADAWAAGEDRAKAMKDVVRSVIRSAIVEMIKSRFKDEVSSMMKYLTETLDKGLVPDEKVLEQYENSMVQKVKPLEPLYDEYMKEDPQRAAASSGVETASQDSIDKVFGSITAIQGHTYIMSESIRDMAVNTALITGYTAQIEAYSKNLLRLESIELNIASMKQDINTINMQGINIKR